MSKWVCNITICGENDILTSKAAKTSVVDKRIVHFMVPFPRNEGFVGESLVLSWFGERERSKAGNTGHHSVALVGLGGIGYV
jgi:hypothetical protein